MVRVLNFFCVALMGLAILALYHVVGRDPRRADGAGSGERARSPIPGAQIGVLQTEWESVAGPARIQQLAQQQLGMSDTTSVRLSSFDQLPRKGDEAAPLGNTPLHNASAAACRASGSRPPALPANRSDRSELMMACEAMAISSGASSSERSSASPLLRWWESAWSM